MLSSADEIRAVLNIGAVGVDNAVVFHTDPMQWNVLDWMRAINNESDVTSFNGQQADVTGFVYRNESFPDGHFMVVRFVISCCVADATPVGLPVYWPEGADLTSDTWVQVEGAFEVGQFANDLVPILHAEAVTVIPQPDHPYLYP